MHQQRYWLEMSGHFGEQNSHNSVCISRDQRKVHSGITGTEGQGKKEKWCPGSPTKLKEGSKGLSRVLHDGGPGFKPRIYTPRHSPKTLIKGKREELQESGSPQIESSSRANPPPQIPVLSSHQILVQGCSHFFRPA